MSGIRKRVIGMASSKKHGGSTVVVLPASKAALRDKIALLESENKLLRSESLEIVTHYKKLVGECDEIKNRLSSLDDEHRAEIRIRRDGLNGQWRAVCAVGTIIGRTPFSFGSATREGPWCAGYGNSPAEALDGLYKKVGEAYVTLKERP